MQQQNQQSVKDHRDDEIDLRELIVTLWQGKWLIAFITAIFFGLGLGYVLFIQTKTASFDIHPITTFEVEKYSELNAFDFFDVDRGTLVALLSERLRERKDFIAAAKQTNLIDKAKFATEAEWEKAIIDFVYKIEIIQPTLNEEISKVRGSDRREFWGIKASGIKDKDQYSEFLYQALKLADEEVRSTLARRYGIKIDLLKRERKYKLEDIERALKNVRQDYDINIADRLAFLKEQAQIARSIGIAKNTLDAQTVSAGASVVTAIQGEAPFYLRGYEAIEKEIALIESRENKDLFIAALVDLDKEKRAILEDPLIERVQLAFELSPIAKTETFQSARFDMDEVEFSIKPNVSLILALLLLIGAFIGSVFVLIIGMLRTLKS